MMMSRYWLLASLVVALLPWSARGQEILPPAEGPALRDAADAAANPPIRFRDATAAKAGTVVPPPPEGIGAGREEVPARVSVPSSVRLPAHPLSVVDVVVLTHQHVGDDVLLNLLRQQGLERSVSAVDVMTLHNEGVSEAVILAMQQAPVPAGPLVPPPPVAAPVMAYPPPVVIQPYGYVAPPPIRYYYAPYYGPYYGPYRPYHGPHWGLSVYAH